MLVFSLMNWLYCLNFKAVVVPQKGWLQLRETRAQNLGDVSRNGDSLSFTYLE